MTAIVVSKRKFPGRKMAGASASFVSVTPSTALKRRHPRPNANKDNNREKSRATLSQLQEEMDLLTSYASDSVYRLRYSTMQYDYISPTVTKLLGFSVEEMKKLNLRSLIVETRIVTDGLKTVKSFDELEAKRKDGDVNKWQADYLMRTRDGRKIWVSDVSYPWFDEKGGIIGSIGSLRDITDRVQAEEKIRKELQQLSEMDTLTGIANRKQFFDEVEKELRRINRTESDVAMLLIGIDHYQSINEHYSPEVVESVIKGVTKIISGAIRVTDMPARFSGESFAVLLPETGTEGAHEVAKRIRNAVLKDQIATGSDKTPVNVSVSIGVAAANPASNIDASALYKLADTRMYIAKSMGEGAISVDNIQQTH